MKSTLTLLFTVAIAIALNAQTTQEPKSATPAQEPEKKIAYEIVPAKRVVTPTKTVTPAETQPTDLSDIKEQQDQQKVDQQIDKRATPASAPVVAPSPKQEVVPVSPKE